MKLRPRYPAQFLISILAAFLLWYGFSAQRSRDISVRGVRAQLTLVNIPADLQLMSGVPDTVAVQLRGPLSRALDPRAPLEVLLDLSDAQPGTSSYPINAADIPLPSEVEVVSIEPSAITLELERRQTLIVSVRPVIEGMPAPGFEIGSVRTAPVQVPIQGPESLLADLEILETAPVSVEGATGPVEGMVQLVVTDPMLRLLSAVPIQVVVEVRPEPTPIPDEEETAEEGG
jgi:YbbR domain-containing protein